MQKGEINIEINNAQPQDLGSIERLLGSVNLPPAGIENCLGSCFIACVNGEIIGSVALEIYGEHALLRSLAVTGIMQGKGISTKLMNAIYQEAAEKKIKALFLLTETMPQYFEKLGFKKIDRQEFPKDVQTSVQFSSECCESATALMKFL